MSIKIMTAVWSTDLPTIDRFVALALADHAHDDGTHVFPSIGSLATKVGLGTTATRMAVRRLEAAGVLIKVRAGGGRGNTSEYRFDVDLLRNPTPSVGFSSDGNPTPDDAKPNASRRISPETQRLTHETQRIGVGEPLEPSELLTVKEPLELAPPSSTRAILANGSRPRDPVWDTLVGIYGDPTATGRGAMNTAAKTLRDYGADPAEIAAFVAAVANTDFNWAVTTPTALAKHYGEREALAAQAAAPRLAKVPDRAAEIRQMNMGRMG